MEVPKPVRECRADTPPALAALIMRLLEKDPAKRPATAGDVLQALDTGRSPPPSGGFLKRAAIVVAAAAVIAAAGVAIASRRATLAPSQERSIAVLPFENGSGQQENEYFGDGMAEELITALNKVPGLRVAARTSAFAFKGKNTDIREIGRQLNVGTVLEGTVRRSGNRLRVSARLVDATNGYQVWSDEYQRDQTDVFAVQDELTRAIVSALQLHLTPKGGAEIAKRGTASVEAYNLYLQGRFFYEKRSEDGLVKAAEAFTSAIKLDSNYAAAYSGLADSYSLLGTFGFRAPLAMLPLAKPAALRALALDSMLAEAHTSLGFIHLFYEFDYDAGNRELTRAIELDPHYAPARLFRSWYYVAAGRTDEAVREVERAQAEDPLSLIINTRHGTMLFWARRYDEAKDQLRRAIVLDSTYLLAHAQLSRAYLMLGNCKASIAEAFMSNTAVGNYESANLAYAMAHCGDTVGARRELAAELELAKHRYVSADVIARMYAGLGETQGALDWLERAYDQRTWSLYLLKVEPMYDNLRGEPRFQALVRKMRLK
jgi:TolB-like protein/Tfp pilus assembly protein PilF